MFFPKGFFTYFFFFLNSRKFRKKFVFYNIDSIENTINDIISNKKNISRFGDGEFRLLIGEKGIGFQPGSKIISQRLQETITSELPNLIIGLPETFSKFNNINYKINYWWLNYINKLGNQIASFLKPEKKYGNSFISRFHLEYRNQSPERVNHILNLLKKIWLNQDVLIVEGRFSRLGIGNDLFDNVKSLQRILCPEKDAFNKYDEIFEATKKFGKDKLILLALGPTATVMAYDLAKENYWAVDIGHIDLEYMWFLMGVKEKSPVVGRLVNETNEKQSLEIPQEFRQQYLNSIIATI